jgi:SulP family sulfate permease
VAVVGRLPQGLPSLNIPKVPFTTYLAMMLPAIGVLLVAFSEALGVAHEFAEKHGYEVDADQELNAHALANLGSALFGGMLAAGGMSASAVKEGVGAHTQVTNLVAWVVTIVTLLFLTPLFAPLPEAVLAVLIIHAVWHIIASRKLEQIRLVSRTEFWFGVLSLAGVLLIDVLQGMLIGLLASLVFVVYRSSRPHISSLGRVPGISGAYSDLSRHPENIPVPGVMIIRLDGPMYYANALTFRKRVITMIEESKPLPRAVIFDVGAQDQLDLTSAEMFKRLVKDLQVRGITVYLADVHVPVREFGRRAGLLEFIRQDQVFSSVYIAVRFLEANHSPMEPVE